MLNLSVKTVAEVVDIYGQSAIERMRPFFQAATVDYPPKRVVLLALKEEKKLEVWATHDQEFAHIRDYVIQKTSGGIGPKLREGDRQVPEGFYKIEGLNPNSAYHLSIKLNYPNSFDLHHAANEGRVEPGSNIFIHGKDVSIGCLAMGI
ncbi:MAG: hypothetical protein R3F37_18625 [Candidatus Competibacteraceae bacterium]